MAIIWILTFLTLLTGGAWAFWLSGKNDKDFDDDSHIIAIIASIATAVTGIFTVANTIEIVSTKNIGVVTVFGKPTGHLDNGFHLVAPWAQVTELDGAIQIENNTGKNATRVRLGNNSVALVENSVRWRINPNKSDELFRDYRNFDSIRDNLVVRETGAAFNDILGSYNPLSSENMDQPGKALDGLAEKITAKLRSRVGENVEILNTIISMVRFDEDTQKRIDLYQTEIANTRIAVQKQKTSHAEAEANKELQSKGSLSSNVLIHQCLEVAKDNHVSPLGCFPIGSAIIGK